MSRLSTLLGNRGMLSSLQAALENGRLPHAVLLAGPDGCGRGYAARCLAADYLYPEGGPGADAVMRGEASELLEVRGEGKSGNIPVERIREVRAGIFHSAMSAAGRVVLIHDAHRMAPPAYNALLKVLEEPPADALFILTTHDATALPATILSRVALYTLAPLPAAECEAALAKRLPEGTGTALCRMLCAVYGGRLGLCLRVAKSEERLATLQEAIEAARCLAGEDRYGLLALFTRFEGRADGDRERRDSLLGDFANILSGSLRGLCIPELPAVDAACAAGALPFIAEARVALVRNAAPKATFSALAVQLVPTKSAVRR